MGTWCTARSRVRAYKSVTHRAVYRSVYLVHSDVYNQAVHTGSSMPLCRRAVLRACVGRCVGVGTLGGRVEGCALGPLGLEGGGLRIGTRGGRVEGVHWDRVGDGWRVCIGRVRTGTECSQCA